MSITEIGQGRFERVRLSDLVTDGRFNRPVRKTHVERIASQFSAGAVGVIEVWKRSDGAYVILDGQHRVEAARLIGIPEDRKVMPAFVHDDLTLDQAAELFVLLNATKLVSAYDRYHALLTAGHSQVADIERIVRTQGLRVASAKTDDSISAVAALMAVYNTGEPEGAVLALGLKTIHEAWGGTAEAYTSPLIRGLGLYFHEHRDQDASALADALVRGPGAPINLIGWAKSIAGPQRMPLADAIAVTIEKRVVVRRRRPKSA